MVLMSFNCSIHDDVLGIDRKRLKIILLFQIWSSFPKLVSAIPLPLSIWNLRHARVLGQNVQLRDIGDIWTALQQTLIEASFCWSCRSCYSQRSWSNGIPTSACGRRGGSPRCRGPRRWSSDRSGDRCNWTTCHGVAWR